MSASFLTAPSWRRLLQTAARPPRLSKFCLHAPRCEKCKSQRPPSPKSRSEKISKRIQHPPFFWPSYLRELPKGVTAACSVHQMSASGHKPIGFVSQFQVEVEFSDGNKFNLSAEFLRVHSPAANSKIRSVGGEKVIFGRRHVGIMSGEPVGNYGIRLVFDDLHKTGIYTWDYFHHLGSNKFTLMKNYIKTLKKHGLTREPLRK